MDLRVRPCVACDGMSGTATQDRFRDPLWDGRFRLVSEPITRLAERSTPEWCPYERNGLTLLAIPRQQ